MKFYNRSETIAALNRLAVGNRPFIFVVDYSGNCSYVGLLDEVDANELLFAFPHHCNIIADEEPGQMGAVNWATHPETIETYRHKFDIVQRHLHAGNSFLTNLTCKVPVETNLSMRDVFLRSQAPYRLWMRNRLVCFSPEPFLRISKGRVSGFPMKGTVDAALPNAEAWLMANEKEAAEHATIVDLIRNDLSIVAKRVYVPRYRYVERLRTNRGEILQTSSEIAGLLPDDYRSRLGDILFSQLPAGSITGAPKPKTVEIIREAEDYDRGFYTGVMGIFDDGEMESAVMIRFIEEEGGRFYFKAGGGITASSDCESEYNEVIQKTYVPIH